MPIDPVKLKKNLGLGDLEPEQTDSRKLIQYINLKLAAMGLPSFGSNADSEFIQIAHALLKNYQEKNRLLADALCPADYRIQSFLDDYLKDAPVKKRARLPSNTFILDRHGLARVLSLPADRDTVVSEYVSSFRVHQGVLHNPKNDRRTTSGVFHITEGGLPIPADKKSVPKHVFGNLLYHALNPPKELLRLPFTSSQELQAETFVSLMMRPPVYPEVEGFAKEKSMEIRFFAPGSLVSNLDFVESIFGNAGDPFLPENDAGLDADHWVGHSGCIILAPHLVDLKKKELGLPHASEATDRQKRDGMFWSEENELYNEGVPFKITCRDHRGIMVTLIGDSYFGYCKKEVKTQISMSANLYGLCEEEHSGGAIAFRSYDLGGKFTMTDFLHETAPGHTFKEVTEKYGELMYVQPEGYAIDKTYPDIFYVPEDTVVDLHKQALTWKKSGKTQMLKLLPRHSYIFPAGYKVSLEKKFGGLYWRIIGTVPEGVNCHKPSTVSGGGKSEISKSIANSIFQGPVFTAYFEKDLDFVDEILKRDYSTRFRQPHSYKSRKSRTILDKDRTLGSVIKLLTPLPEYTDAYNEWLESIPNHIKELVFIVKRFYNSEEDTNWRQHFGVDLINGRPGHELKYNGVKLVANYLRVGFQKDGGWRSFQLRRDYNAAEKLQMEDDITSSVIVPTRYLDHLNESYSNSSVKMVRNCEYRLFQRPDDAIHRGYDKETEADLAKPNCFISNFEPLTRKDAKELVEDAVGFDQYTDAIKNLIQDFLHHGKSMYFVSTAHPRIVDGKPTKNPRYLQDRPDLVDPRKTYLAHMGARLYRKVPIEKPVHFPVNSVLIGRRNNPPDSKAGIRSLAVYNPIHYQELPELFMDFICSLTGKSPSTTGAGSEGALTKGPFNALLPSADLNNALVSFILTGYHGYSSAAGYIGPNIRIDHDISLLIPEIWCRMMIEEREPKFLIENGYLEKMEDFTHQGKTIMASRLGYRITKKFVNIFLGRIFNNPSAVFTDEMLKPEIQDRDIFADGVLNITEAQQRVAEMYLHDGSYEMVCPPLKALLNIMIYGKHEGKTIEHPDIRRMFTREYLLESEWYKERLLVRQASEIQLMQRHVQYLENFLSKASHSDEAERLEVHEQLKRAKERLENVKSASYLEHIHDTIGADPVSQERLAMLGIVKKSKISV